MITLPSKKVLSVFILITALVLAIIITFGKDKSSEAINFASNLTAGEKLQLPENPNWQSELENISTSQKASPEETPPSGPETNTGTVSKNLISNYLALKQNGALDEKSITDLVDQTTNLINQLGDDMVLETKLNIIADNGRQSVSDYGENLGNILKNNEPAEIKNEFKIISDAVSSRNHSKINELDSVIAVYEKTANDLTKMPVPKTFVEAHLNMANSLRVMAMSLKEIKKVFDDPINGLQFTQLLEGSAATFAKSLEETKSFIIQNRIIYKQNSGGYYLLYGI